MKYRRSLRRILIKTFLTVVSFLPLRAVHAVAAAFGWCAWRFKASSARTAAINIRLCMPDLEPGGQDRLVREGLIEDSKAIFELGPMWRWPAERVSSLVRISDGFEALRATLASGRGVIAIAPHLGAWEATGLVLSRTGPMTSMFMQGRLGIDDDVRKARERAGARLVPADRNGVMALARTLREGGIVGILPDQDPGHGGFLFAPFFGVPARTMTLLSRLAIRSRAAAFVVWCERLTRGRGYLLRCRPAAPAVHEGPLARSVAAVNAAIEKEVRRAPAQYLWSYKRFRFRPNGEISPYKVR